MLGSPALSCTRTACSRWRPCVPRDPAGTPPAEQGIRTPSLLISAQYYLPGELGITQDRKKGWLFESLCDHSAGYRCKHQLMCAATAREVAVFEKLDAVVPRGRRGPREVGDIPGWVQVPARHAHSEEVVCHGGARTEGREGAAAVEAMVQANVATAAAVLGSSRSATRGLVVVLEGNRLTHINKDRAPGMDVEPEGIALYPAAAMGHFHPRVARVSQDRRRAPLVHRVRGVRLALPVRHACAPMDTARRLDTCHIHR